ncbi:catabolic L-serine/threonine dehydratase [Podospora pseudopauciseta]|uniref:L-serine ammonia-lyase n=1 Tax=Podospora pseudopauciseta TaxID=2093780 RepID=A0ABR0HNV4_9PEZI|nr:catabolic L-serine/threonine dehydratase [Podospora pseudopauciseta]
MDFPRPLSIHAPFPYPTNTTKTTPIVTMASIPTPAPSPPPSTKGTTTTTTTTTTTAQDTLQPWIETPLIYSAQMSRNAGCNIYLKLENVQPSGSFKSRGIGNMMLEASQSTPPTTKTHFLCSSGGNAGLACATTSLSLPNSTATIVVPLSTSPFMVQKLKDAGAQVVQKGQSWIEADTFLREELLAKDTPGVENVYVPPFDHPAIWRGASTLIDEVVRQMPEGQKMDAVVCNVGGGGLVNGVCEGVHKHGLEDGVKVVALETEGADSLFQSTLKGELVTLEGITSLATSLGARTVSGRTWEWYQQMKGGFVSGVVTDKEAAEACVRFLDEGRVMVELSCGATLAGVYKDQGRWLREQVGKGVSDEEWKGKNVVVVVCGGSNVSWEILEGYKKTFGF